MKDDYGKHCYATQAINVVSPLATAHAMMIRYGSLIPVF
jgi:hypothetical protein